MREPWFVLAASLAAKSSAETASMMMVVFRRLDLTTAMRNQAYFATKRS